MSEPEPFPSIGARRPLRWIPVALVAAVVAALVVSAAGLRWPGPDPRRERPSPPVAQSSTTPRTEIGVEGDEKFTKQVRAALDLLKAKDPEAFAIVEKNIGRIRQNQRSGMDVYATPPTFDLSDVSAYSSLEWCAGTIAHDSIHAKQFFDKAAEIGPDAVPSDLWTGTESERACNAHQLRVLEKIGASRKELDYMASLDGTHSDVDGDGDYDWDDYKARNW